MTHSIFESQSQSLGNIDEITQRVNTLNALLCSATKRDAEAIKYCTITTIAEQRAVSGKFSRNEMSFEEFTTEMNRAAAISIQNKLIAQAAKDNVAFLNARIVSLTKLKDAIVQENIQTEILVRLAAEYKKSVDLRDQAILDRTNALKAFSDAEKLIETKSPAPTITLFDSLCVSLGAQTGTASMLKEPAAVEPSRGGYCDNSRCTEHVLKPHTRSDRVGKTYCSMACMTA